MKKGIELTVDETNIKFRKELVLEHFNPTDKLNRCLPEEIKKGSFYKFGIEGYVVFPVGKAIRLFENGSREMVASIEITEQTQFLLGGTVDTRGEYLVRVCSENYKEMRGAGD